MGTKRPWVSFAFLALTAALVTPAASGGVALPPQGTPVGLAVPDVLDFAPAFGDHMVLPRDVPIPVWGRAAAGATVRVEFGDVHGEAVALEDGTWRVLLPAQAANSKPRTLILRSGEVSLRRSDVLVGDVWLCAGQSNMDFPLKRSVGLVAALERAELPDLRLWDQASRMNPGGGAFPLELIRSVGAGALYQSGGWRRSDPDQAAEFSAVAWYFGERLTAELGVPIGLIDVSVGGSPMEAWIPAATLVADPKLAPLLEGWLENPAYPAWCQQRARRNLGVWLAEPAQGAAHHPFEPAFLFDQGVAPLASFPIKGVLWYQGESNATVDGGLGRPVACALNQRKLEALVAGWRAAFERADLPFLMVQLPGLNREWAGFRDVQARVAREDARVHLAVTIDLGSPTDVHPRLKQPVGERLARLALAQEYGRDLVPTGPTFRDARRSEAGVMRVLFDHAAGLRTTDGAAPLGFALCGEDGRFHPAAATIDGESVLLRAEPVPVPVAVRYAWENDPYTNLVGEEALPAAPFRSDQAPVLPKIRVACIGDSITFGTGLADRGRSSYPARLEQLLGPDYAVRNFGRPGSGVVQRSKHGELPRAFQLVPQHVAALAWEPDVVVCNLGVNDVMDWERYGQTDFVGDYRELIGLYRALPTQPRILLWCPLTPLFEGQAFHGDARLVSIEQAIAEVARAEDLELLDLRTPLASHPEWFAPDHTHPLAIGALAIAEVVAQALR